MYMPHTAAAATGVGVVSHALAHQEACRRSAHAHHNCRQVGHKELTSAAPGTHLVAVQAPYGGQQPQQTYSSNMQRYGGSYPPQPHFLRLLLGFNQQGSNHEGAAAAAAAWHACGCCVWVSGSCPSHAVPWTHAHVLPTGQQHADHVRDDEHDRCSATKHAPTCRVLGPVHCARLAAGSGAAWLLPAAAAAAAVGSAAWHSALSNMATKSPTNTAAAAATGTGRITSSKGGMAGSSGQGHSTGLCSSSGSSNGNRPSSHRIWGM